MVGEARLGELETPGVEWDLVMQAWEQDVAATDEALSDLVGGVGQLARGGVGWPICIHSYLWLTRVLTDNVGYSRCGEESLSSGP